MEGRAPTAISPIRVGREALIGTLVSRVLLDRIEEAGAGARRRKLASIGESPAERPAVPGSGEALVRTRLNA
jgi:hypothetical protein